MAHLGIITQKQIPPCILQTQETELENGRKSYERTTQGKRPREANKQTESKRERKDQQIAKSIENQKEDTDTEEPEDVNMAKAQIKKETYK